MGGMKKWKTKDLTKRGELYFTQIETTVEPPANHKSWINDLLCTESSVELFYTTVTKYSNRTVMETVQGLGPTVLTKNKVL